MQPGRRVLKTRRLTVLGLRISGLGFRVSELGVRHSGLRLVVVRFWGLRILVPNQYVAEVSRTVQHVDRAGGAHEPDGETICD